MAIATAAFPTLSQLAAQAARDRLQDTVLGVLQAILWTTLPSTVALLLLPGVQYYTGQALDMEATGHEIDLARLENLHIHKTGALILASVRLGALAAGADGDDRVTGLEHYARCVGLAFQVHDDVLDVADADAHGAGDA